MILSVQTRQCSIDHCCLIVMMKIQMRRNLSRMVILKRRLKKVYIPYSGKFSSHKSFAVFENRPPTSKI